jgi:hypothetical protein
MPRPSRRASAPHGLAPSLVAGLVAIVVLVAACSAPAATTSPSIVVDTTPAPPPGEQARAAFVARVLAGNLTYHATFVGTVYGVGDDLPVTGSLDVAGADYQLAATYTLPKPPKPPKQPKPDPSYAIRYVGGTAWVRIDGGKWAKDADFRATVTNSPFGFIASERDVTLEGSETVSGTSLHRVMFVRTLVIDLSKIRADNLTDEELTMSRFDLVLDDDGTPVSGTARVEGTGRVSGRLHEIIVQVELEFSKVGADIVNKAP